MRKVRDGTRRFRLLVNPKLQLFISNSVQLLMKTDSGYWDRLPKILTRSNPKLLTPFLITVAQYQLLVVF